MAQKFNHPYGSLGAKPKAAPMKPEGDLEAAEAGAGDHAAIHQHLQEQNAMDGKAHTHVVHNGDGSHTSHHVAAHGEVSGPHDHANLEDLKNSFDHFVGEEENEGHEDGEEHEGY
jgi:hypothetical protein